MKCKIDNIVIRQNIKDINSKKNVPINVSRFKMMAKSC